MAMLAAGQGVVRGRKGGECEVEGGIWLHSYRYVLPGPGIGLVAQPAGMVRGGGGRRRVVVRRGAWRLSHSLPRGRAEEHGRQEVDVGRAGATISVEKTAGIGRLELHGSTTKIVPSNVQPTASMPKSPDANVATCSSPSMKSSAVPPSTQKIDVATNANNKAQHDSASATTDPTDATTVDRTTQHDGNNDAVPPGTSTETTTDAPTATTPQKSHRRHCRLQPPPTSCTSGPRGVHDRDVCARRTTAHFSGGGGRWRPTGFVRRGRRWDGRYWDWGEEGRRGGVGETADG